jgi:hypothetical protein
MVKNWKTQIPNLWKGTSSPYKGIGIPESVRAPGSYTMRGNKSDIALLMNYLKGKPKGNVPPHILKLITKLKPARNISMGT